MRSPILIVLILLCLAANAQHYYLFVGTYTNGNSKGIYVYDFNASTGDALLLGTTAAQNPSYLEIAPGGHYMYAVNENGGSEGSVSSFSFDKATGKLDFINQQPSGGEAPCFLSVDKNRKWAVVANYSGGSLAALPIQSDGSLAPVAELIPHLGRSKDTIRQEKAHVHSTFLSPDQKYVWSADLGMDKLMVYPFDPNASQPLNSLKVSTVDIQAGSGPRHLAFHPHQPFVYLLEELTGTIDVYHYHLGTLKHQQRIRTTPAEFKGFAGSADIHITPNGKFLYASNRGDANNIAIYKIDSSTGKLQIIGYQSVLGKHPRNFIIEPGGHLLLVANRDSDNIVLFRINSKTGSLVATGKEISVPNPVCLKLLRLTAINKN